MRKNCWLPCLEYFDNYKSWKYYEDSLYTIFKNDFLKSYPLFKNVRVNVKHYPIKNGKEEAFFHFTSKDYDGDGERYPDLKRCERIRWIRAFIENYECNASLCNDCKGVKVWREPYKSKIRVHILLEEERFIVILEERKGYFLLITAFYLNYDNSLEKQLKHYEQFKRIC